MRPLRVYTAEGIVLKRHVAGEADRILTVFTKKHGKIKILAKGVRRITSRRAGHIEVFSHVLLTIHATHGLGILSEAQAVDRGFIDLDVAKFGYAYCMCELVDQLLADGQEEEDVFFFLRDSLKQIKNSSDPVVWHTTIARFVHHVLWKLGFLSPSRRLPETEMRSYIEEITERKLRAWPLLTLLRGTA